MDPYGGFQAKVDFVGEASYGPTPHKPTYTPQNQFYAPVKPEKPIYSPPKPTYSPPKPTYRQLAPSYTKPYLQASPSNFHSTYVLPQSPIYNNVIYTPSSYVPAPIQVYESVKKTFSER